MATRWAASYIIIIYMSHRDGDPGFEVDLVPVWLNDHLVHVADHQIIVESRHHVAVEHSLANRVPCPPEEVLVIPAESPRLSKQVMTLLSSCVSPKAKAAGRRSRQRLRHSKKERTMRDLLFMSIPPG